MFADAADRLVDEMLDKVLGQRFSFLTVSRWLAFQVAKKDLYDAQAGQLT